MQAICIIYITLLLAVSGNTQQYNQHQPLDPKLFTDYIRTYAERELFVDKMQVSCLRQDNLSHLMCDIGSSYTVVLEMS